MSKQTFAVDNRAMASKALEARLPECRNMRVAGNFASGSGHFNASLDKYVVRGDLPSGREYEVPIDVNLNGIYYDDAGAWVNSTELARELKKAVRAFKVAVALDGPIAHDDSMREAGRNCPRCQERKGASIRVVDPGVYGFSGATGVVKVPFGIKDLATIEAHQKEAMAAMSESLNEFWLPEE
jgi:hypothetical protein